MVKLSCKSKVNNLDIRPFEHNVGRLQVTMKNVRFSHGLHRANKLGKYPEGFLLLEPLMQGKILRQTSSFAVFQKDIEIGLGFFDIDEIDDVLMFGLDEELDFPFKDVSLVLFDLVSGDDFDGKLLTGGGVGEVDLGEGANTEKSVSDVV